jgi:hypothetical protein
MPIECELYAPAYATLSYSGVEEVRVGTTEAGKTEETEASVLSSVRLENSSARSL